MSNKVLLVAVVAAALGLGHAALIGTSPLSPVFDFLGAIGLIACSLAFGWWLASVSYGKGG